MVPSRFTHSELKEGPFLYIYKYSIKGVRVDLDRNLEARITLNVLI